MLVNILNNAADALILNKNERKLIFIEAYQRNNYSYIKIKDNAGGIPENIIDRIFEPYFTTKHKSLGTGIGLYMSQEIITKQLKGKLSVYNKSLKYENKDYFGACFKIDI